MSGVWVFKNGVYRLVENSGTDGRSSSRRKVLVHVPTGEIITSHSMLESKLAGLGWERYRPRVDPGLLQYHNHSSLDLISLPKHFSHLTSVHMYDIVVKCRDAFEVRDILVRTA